VLHAPAVVTAALLVTVGSAWLALRPSSEAPIRAVAVLPFANWMADPAQDFFVEGMHDALISELASVSDLTVIARTSVERYRATRMPVSEIAAELTVDAVIEGSVFRAADSVRINISVIRGSTQESMFSQSFHGSVRDALNLQRLVTQRIAEVLRVDLSHAEIERLTAPTAVEPAVHELYLRGRAHWRTRSAEGLARAVELLEAAVAQDPEFALAHAALADAYTVARGYGAIDMPWAEAYARAGLAAERALELDPDLPEAHASLAFLRFQSDRDLDAAERGLKRAVELNGSNAQALAWLSTVQRARGRSEDAIASARRASALDPFAPVMNRYLAFTLAKTGHCDEAVEYANTAIDLAPEHPDGYLVRWTCHALAGRYEEAAAAGRDAFRAWGLEDADLDAHAESFRTGGWPGLLDREIELLETRRVPVRTEYFIAQRQALLGRVDDAFVTLERAWVARDPILVFELRLDPLIQSVRSDPRYHRLAGRVGVLD
jgi:TolB-like protein/Tfp pilus assembly protein PilF